MANSREISVLLVGNAEAGKTSLCTQFVDETFSESHVPTIGIDLSKRTIDNTQFKIWDTASDKMYKVLTNRFYANKDIYIIVLSNDDKEALENLQRYEKTIMVHSNNPDATKLVVVNKCDLTGPNTVLAQKSKLEDYCELKKLPIHYISATNHEEVESFFKAAALQHLRKQVPEIELKSHEQKSQPLSQPQTKALFDNYLKWYKFRLFGTHHIDRAKAVKAVLEAIDSSHGNFNKNQDKLKIIQNQIDLFENKKQTDESIKEVERLGLNAQWATRLKNNPHYPSRPSELLVVPGFNTLLKGGYYRELVRIKKQLDHEIKSEEQQTVRLSSSSPGKGI